MEDIPNERHKKNTGDARETPAARIAELLTALGVEVRAADPHVLTGVHLPGQRGPFNSVPRVTATPEELAAADAVLLLADHDAFDYPTVTEHARYVLACRNRVSGAQVEVL
ncbi:UDP binding domain-containing protein [Kitasatospora azatica]|uniref:UDP binding domain-containing protein n=1 Tax=Kitasatospora azatica TaxID=58347 RepID=UPI00056B5E82|nr:UDP binding domain-containing protein [Kitasatospora azatica]